jgi:hypothetical protein
VEDGEGFTVIYAALEAGEAEVACDVLRAAGLDARVVESDQDDSMQTGIVADLCDVIVPSGQAEAAVAMVEAASPTDAAPLYRPSPLVVAMPLIWIGGLVLAGAVIVPAISVVRAGDLDALTDAGWGAAAIAAVVGLIMVLGPLLANLPRREPRPAAPPRSRIVS